jgi:hypothetical protein
MKIPKKVVESKIENKLLEDNKNLKLTILKILHQIQLFENNEINREKDINVIIYNSEMLFTNFMRE